MAKTANERLFDETVRRRLYVLRYAEMAAASVARLLDEAERELIGKIADALTRGTSTARLESLLRSVKEQRDQAYELAGNRAMTDLLGLAQSESTWERNLLNAVVPVDLVLGEVAIDALRAAIMTPISGLSLDRWLDGIKAAELQAIERAIRLGVAQGGTRAGKPGGSSLPSIGANRPSRALQMSLVRPSSVAVHRSADTKSPASTQVSSRAWLETWFTAVRTRASAFLRLTERMPSW
jgi:hypothetical protein